jgi:hypothetical protein
VGDFNGDGYADLAVGAPYYDGGYTNEGKVFVYLGSASGPLSAPFWAGQGGQADAHLGAAVAGAGDVNGDGLADLVVGAPDYDEGQTNEGCIFILLGSNTAPQSMGNCALAGEQANAYFGAAVAGAGDVDGDGYADVIVGAYGYSNDLTSEGAAFLYRGSASGLQTTASWLVEGNQINGGFGAAVSGAGDVNQDGFSDVVVGAYKQGSGEESQAGRAYVYHGSANGLSASPSWLVNEVQPSAHLGFAVAGAGDVNGDGYSDVIVGAPDYDNGQADEGRAYLYHGSAAGLGTSANWTTESNQAGAQYGWSVAAAGDVNGDGYSDVVVGAPYFDGGQTDEGKAFVYHGTVSGLSASANWTAESNQANAHFGWSVAAAGDANGDGYADVIAGAPEFDNGHTDEGGIFLYYGNGGPGISLLPRQMQWNSNTPLAPLGLTASADIFDLELIGRTPFGRGDVRLEWQAVPLGTSFDGAAIQHGNWTDTDTQGVALSGGQQARQYTAYH